MRPVKPGDPISSALTAKRWNEIQAQLNKSEEAAKQRPPLPTNHDMVVVQGDFSSDVYTAVQLGNPAFPVEGGAEDDVDNNYYVYPLVEAGPTLIDPMWLVLQDYLAPGQPARAVITGLTWAYVDIIDLDHTYVGVNSTSDGLESKTSGTSKIVHNPTGATGEHYVLIHKTLVGATEINEIVVPVSSISGGSSGLANIQAGSPLSDAGTTLTLHNISATTLPAGCQVIAHWCSTAGIWATEPRVTDIRLNETEAELRYNCGWSVWATGRRCPDGGTSSSGISSSGVSLP